MMYRITQANATTNKFTIKLTISALFRGCVPFDQAFVWTPNKPHKNVSRDRYLLFPGSNAIIPIAKPATANR